MTSRDLLFTTGVLLTAAAVTTGCRPPGPRTAATTAVAATATYVEPGKKDEVLPVLLRRPLGPGVRCRHCRRCGTSPPFPSSPSIPRPATASTRSRGRCWATTRWGDVHHPGLSQTDGKYDGRWLFVNDNANNRVARVDLRDFKTRQILGPIPNSSGNHGSSFVTENSEYVLVATRFSVPLPKGRYAEPSTLRVRVQRHGERSQGRSGDGHSVGRLADSHSALQLGSRVDRQGAELRLGVLDLVQQRDGIDVIGGQRHPSRSRLRSDRQLAGRGAGRQGRQGDDAGRRGGDRSGKGAGRPLLPAGPEIATRHRHRSVRPLDRCRRQAGAARQRVRLRRRSARR